MFRRAVIQLLFLGCSYAAESLSLGGKAGTVTIPAAERFTSLGDSRIELRLHGIRNCTQPASQLLHIPKLLSIRCNGLGSVYQISDFNTNRTFRLNSGSDVILRIQRSTIAGWIFVEKWNARGGEYENFSFISPGTAGTIDVSGENIAILGGAGTVVDVAWMRWYSTVLASGSLMPLNSAGDADLANWSFEGGGSDSSGNQLHITVDSGYSGTPIYPPVPVISTAYIRAGAPSEIDASRSVSFTDSPETSTYTWRQIAGPTNLLFNETSGPKATVRGAVAGTYTVELTVSDSSGQSTTIAAELRARAVDFAGVPILASNKVALTAKEVAFQWQEGAAKARLTVVKADGRSLPPVECSQSPCSVLVDPRYTDHSIKVELFSEDGTALTAADTRVLTQSEALPSPQTPPPGRYNRMAVVNYGATTGFLGNKLNSVVRFMADKYDIFLAGESPLPYNAEAMALTYRDMAALYPTEMPTLKGVAERHGYNFEDILLHMNVNHTFDDGRYAWSGMDRFDTFDRGAGGYRNGVLQLTGGKYADKTQAAYDNTAADVAISDMLLLGYSEPFDEINFVLSTPASNVTVAWEYWGGSGWKPLTLGSDATGGLTQSGRIRFTPPADWNRKSENGSIDKWWVRVAVTGSGVRPVASRVTGDDWAVPGQTLTWRGWDATSPSIVNKGLGPLEYNPTPPENATARFRYQARLLGLWANNLAFANLANVQNGERTWVRHLVESSLPEMLATGRNGIFFDDGTAAPNRLVKPANWQRETEIAGLDYFNEQAATYKDAREYLLNFLPNGKVGINSTIWDIVRHGDAFLVELTDEVHKGGIYHYNVLSDKRWWSSGSYDQLRPENNPNGTKGMYSTWDTRGSDFVWNGDFVIWDRGNRSPITALAAYYIVANENTRFLYNVEGWTYSRTDQFYYFDEKPNFATGGALEKDMSGGKKQITGDFRDFPATPTRGATVRIGSTGEYLPLTKVNDNLLTTTDVIANSYPAGTPMYLVREGNLAIDPLPPVERIYLYSNWFPAVGIDIGEPDASGYNAGKRDLNWKSPGVAGTHNGIQRRDFTGAIVLNASGASSPGHKFAQYGNEIELGGTYYPLRSDGTTGAGISVIRLRTGEGAILMKEPIF